MNRVTLFSMICAAALVAGCGSGGSVDSSGETSVVPGSESVVSSSLTLQASPFTTTPGGAIQFTASGGVAPYSFINSSNVGQLNALTGYYVAPPYAATVTIQVSDAAGATAFATISVLPDPTGTGTAPGVPGPLSLRASTGFISAGGTAAFTAGGGIAPYTFVLLSGSGSLSVTGSTMSNSTVYTSSSSESGTVQVQVLDSSVPQQASYASLTVTASSDGSTGGTPTTDTRFSKSFVILSDDQIGITLDNSNPAAQANPSLVFFGTGSKPNRTEMLAHSTNTYCGYDFAGNVFSPCVTSVPLTNFSNTAPGTTTYEGTVYFQGRNGSGSVAFCIDPNTNTSVAYVSPLQASGTATSQQFLTMAYNESGHVLLNGRFTRSFFSQVDTDDDAYWVSVAIQNAGYTSNTSCAAYSVQNYIQAM